MQKNKRGLSAVVGTIILIALTVAIFAGVWVVVNNLVKEETEESKSCFGIFEKVSLDKEYTCYNHVNKKLEFMLKIEDVEIESVKVSVSGDLAMKSFDIGKEDSTTNFLSEYDAAQTTVTLPLKDSGKTYVVDTTILGTGIPNSIKVAPTINGNLCEVSDEISGIGSCLLQV